MRSSSISYAFALALLGVPSLALENYVNEFIDPSYILSGDFANATTFAQQSIVEWADALAAQGPWSVITSKPDGFNAPSNDSHDYVSWAPYWWPDCSKAGNKTELTPQQTWVTCPYVNRDGQFNPDRLEINNTGAFSALSDAVLYNTLAWRINGSSTYSSNVASWIKTWFLDPATAMNPNLNFAQVIRGPGAYYGAHTGVLDLKCMAKVATGILTLRQGKSPDWTDELDAQMKNWTQTYIQWMETSPIALGEGWSLNNHGSFYFNQLASLYLILDEPERAKNVSQSFFEGIYQNQIIASGDQPLEAERTHPYHYRGYNLAAIITNARLLHYAGGADAYNITAKSGAGIKQALDFAIAQNAGEEPLGEIHPYVAFVASTYGDPDGRYAKFLESQNAQYPEEPYFFWNQPLGDSGFSQTHAIPTPSQSANSSSASKTPASFHSGTAINQQPTVLAVLASLLLAALFS
ncbi:unnamed protein product [Peniophora sp. CBMAI 1063]|nr:unnamed protein product [Peniophora sp. CBMAI 1063]